MHVRDCMRVFSGLSTSSYAVMNCTQQSVLYGRKVRTEKNQAGNGCPMPSVSQTENE